MTTPQDVAVTYTGTDTPFKDRIYRSGLTFAPGQTRLVPATLAQRFLRHSDVFKEGAVGEAKAAKKAKAEQDDTKQVLEQQQQEQEEQRQQEDARFAMIDSIESMDRKAVIEWADQHYKQKIHHNTSLEKAREMAKGFIDQYGMPA
jgi:5'-3' exonuclease